MNKFDVSSYLQPVYGRFPEAKERPIIGITANYEDGRALLAEKYYKQVVDAGGTPLLIVPVPDTDVIINTLDTIDGLLLTGGGDYNPLWAGEDPVTALHHINDERDLPELLLVRLAYNRQIPMLGVCRGMQTLAMALGGHVRQDIGDVPNLIKHSQDARQSEATHRVTVSAGTMLHGIYQDDVLLVNSFHHQAVDDAGEKFNVSAVAPDGVVEAMESSEEKPILGVQWHPEWLGADGLKLFQWLCQEAMLLREARRMHDRVLTLDSHCDTPMFFSKGVDIAKRDGQILVDLHKMSDGRQDVVTMVAYLPQPKPGECFDSKVPFDVVGPKHYADLLFNKIEDMVAANGDYVGIARTPDEAYQLKSQGKKAIMLGIENGHALEEDLRNVWHYARRGVVYITLCHNGDNAICDSARGNATHGGVSEFGEQVIREMNARGVMVDLSHAGEKSFYDALDISSQPVVCSHSNCRALCDVPRNLTDDQMRALAAKGGVMQITLYHGFLRKEGRVTLTSALEHLDHAIRVMGIDHVGLGTDFDGDGGIIGMADSSEMLCLTRELLRRRYAEEDIRRIWGENWFRVMRQVQKDRK